MDIPVKYKQSVNKYEPIEINGLTLYPVLVKDYEKFLIARPVLEFLLQTLPVRFATMPLLSALYALDYDNIIKTGESLGFLYKVSILLTLVLRLSPEYNPDYSQYRFEPYVCEKNPAALISLLIKDEQGNTKMEISPQTFTLIRPIIAAQNGITLYSDSANPDLIEAERDILTQKNMNINVDFYELKSALAMICNSDENDIDEWPILKFNRRQTSIRRVIDYVICAIVEGSGGKWKGGNPCPDPFYGRIQNENISLIPLNQFANGEGAKAVMQNFQKT